MSKTTFLIVISAVALALVALVAVFVIVFGTEKDDGPLMVNGEPKTELYERMHDENYIRELKVQEEKTNDAFGEAVKLKQRLDAAKAEGDEAAIAELQAQHKAALEKLQAIRLETQAKVRERILQEAEEK